MHETFKKVLFISPAVRGEFTSGRVFNLVTSDAETLQMLSQNIMGLISSPLRIIVAMLMLYLELGISSIVALGVLLLLMPTQVLHALTDSLQLKMSKSGQLESLQTFLFCRKALCLCAWHVLAAFVHPAPCLCRLRRPFTVSDLLRFLRMYPGWRLHPQGPPIC